MSFSGELLDQEDTAQPIMNPQETHCEEFGIVYLYDPIPLDKVSLDDLKKSFPQVAQQPGQEIFLDAPERDQRARILSARMDYVDQKTTNTLSELTTEPLEQILRALPSPKIKSIGISLDLRYKLVDVTDAAAFTTRHFLKDAAQLQEKLGANIFASSQRFTYGELVKYYDVTVGPAAMTGAVFTINLYSHLSIELIDPDRIYQETVVSKEAAIVEVQRIQTLL